MKLVENTVRIYIIYVTKMPKGILYMYIFKAHFSSPYAGYINGPTAHVFEQSAFIRASFSSLFDIHKCSGGLQMAESSLGKQTADCD